MVSDARAGDGRMIPLGHGRRLDPDQIRRSSRARPAANALHEKHSRRVLRDVEALVAGLAENVPAHTGARFVVETMGTAIRGIARH